MVKGQKQKGRVSIKEEDVVYENLKRIVGVKQEKELDELKMEKPFRVRYGKGKRTNGGRFLNSTRRNAMGAGYERDKRFKNCLA